MSHMPPENLFPNPVLLPMATRSLRVLSNRVSEASAAIEASVAPTVLDSEETDGEATVDSVAFPAGVPHSFQPKTPPLAPPSHLHARPVSTSCLSYGPVVTHEAQSHSPHMPPAGTHDGTPRAAQRPPAGPAAPPPQMARIISPGLLPVLPISTQPPHRPGPPGQLSTHSRTSRAAHSRSPRRPPAPPAQTARVISPGLLPVPPVSAPPPHGSEPTVPIANTEGEFHEDPFTEGPPWGNLMNGSVMDEDPFAEEPPWGNLMNGSVMDEPYVPPPQPRGPREPALLLVAPAAQEFLPMHLGGIGAPLSIGAALRDALVGTPRLATTLRISSDPRGIEEGWGHAFSRIHELAARGMAFYIGITENPARRWGDHCQAAPWDDIKILIEAPSSHVTAELERRLIDRFRPVIGCANVGPGGECCSAGHPHYLYVLVRQSGLLRRSF